MIMTDEKVQLVALPLELVNTVVAYLERKPYYEVVGFIDGIKKSAVGVSTPEPIKSDAIKSDLPVNQES